MLLKHARHTLPFLSLAFLCSKEVIGNEIKISSANNFKTFVSHVNSGKTFLRTTVLLDSDLSLSGETLEPIGNSSSYYFRGIFDGQGHVISNLKMNSTSQYTGLFGCSTGLTIRNIVLDPSCSITNSFSGSKPVYTGGIIGSCNAKDGRYCNIENSVNMADVAFGGDISYTLNLGGIAGYISSSPNYSAYVKNCANYGSVTHSGVSSNTRFGGIVGELSGSSYKYLQNNLNYGTITHNGTTKYTMYLGGIAGYSSYACIENSVNAGKISTQASTTNDNCVGSIVGYAYSYTTINYCYYTSELSEYNLYRKGTPENISYTLSYDNNTFELNDVVSIGSYTGTSIIGALNAAADYYVLRGYSKWLLNKERKSVKFTLNSRTIPITMNCQVILLPSLASEGNISFYGWYNDSECANPLESFEITGDTELYGKFKENTNYYTITFDTRREGSSVPLITAQFGTVVSLPSKSLRDYCSVAFWENEYGDYVGLSLTMPAHNFTLYAVWKCTHIAVLDDFMDFSKVVNSGTDNYSETTVLLDSDLSLSGIAEPVGKDTSNYFRGVFDGQGYIISGLKMNSSSQYTGIFGYSEELTIRNVVLSSSCSVTSSYSGLGDVYSYVGGIIGSCSASRGECNIENSVNIADVTFSGGTSSSNLHLGGIAGQLSSSSNYKSYVKNCANYGSVIHSGTSSISRIGGIFGYLYGSKYKYIYNCLNYGTIIHSGTTSNTLYFGGIVGYNSYTHIENSVSAGKISTQNTPSKSYIGSIVGYVDSYTSINYCYYTSDVGDYGVNGTGMPINTAGTPDSPTTVDSTLISELNDYASSNGWNKWLLNANNKTIPFIINNNGGLNLSSQLILLPDPIDGWRSFVGWFSDSTYTTLFSSSSISYSTTLYGRWDKYVVKFDANGGSELSATSIIVSFGGTYSDLPETNRTGYTFIGWFKDNDVNVTSETPINTPYDHTLYAHWSANSYTIKFDVNGGNELTENETIVAFNNTYSTLPEVTRTGYMFLGWFTNKTDGTAVTNETIVTTPNNHTLYAHWSTNSYTVTFDVNGGNELAENKKTVVFDSEYGELPKVTRTGYMFLGWFTEKANGTKVANETIVTTPNNHTLYAHWEETTNYVEIVFNKKDLTREDVEKIVQEYVDEGTEFTIVEISTDETGETKVIIKFAETEEAENFIINIRESSEVVVKKVGFVFSYGSFSSKLYPTLLLVVLLSI